VWRQNKDLSVSPALTARAVTSSISGRMVEENQYQRRYIVTGGDAAEAALAPAETPPIAAYLRIPLCLTGLLEHGLRHRLPYYKAARRKKEGEKNLLRAHCAQPPLKRQRAPSRATGMAWASIPGTRKQPAALRRYRGRRAT